MMIRSYSTPISGVERHRRKFTQQTPGTEQPTLRQQAALQPEYKKKIVKHLVQYVLAQNQALPRPLVLSHTPGEIEAQAIAILQDSNRPDAVHPLAWIAPVGPLASLMSTSPTQSAKRAEVRLFSLPSELLDHVVDFLDIPSRVILSLTCRDMYFREGYELGDLKTVARVIEGATAGDPRSRQYILDEERRVATNILRSGTLQRMANREQFYQHKMSAAEESTRLRGATVDPCAYRLCALCCSACMVFHPRCCFSSQQTDELPERRVCLATSTTISICEHTSWSIAEMDRYLCGRATVVNDLDGESLWSVELQCSSQCTSETSAQNGVEVIRSAWVGGQRDDFHLAQNVRVNIPSLSSLTTLDIVQQLHRFSKLRPCPHGQDFMKQVCEHADTAGLHVDANIAQLQAASLTLVEGECEVCSTGWVLRCSPQGLHINSIRQLGTLRNPWCQHWLKVADHELGIAAELWGKSWR